MRRRLHQWGFNTAGAWSLPPAEIGLPSTPELELGRSVQFVWTDPFDPAIEPVVRRAAVEAVAPYRGNPLRIGYFSDNEIGWWNGPVFMAFLGYPPENHTKRRLVALLQAHYGGDWRAFARDFVPAPQTAGFDDLLATRMAPHLRPGGTGIEVIRVWAGVLAARYYSVMREALRAADPEALYLGDRLPIYYDPDAVRAMAPFVDAISVNYNVDAADGWIAPYFFAGLRDLSGGKPVLITEWFYAAAENRSGNLNRTGVPRADAQQRISNNRNRTGHLMTVATQEERARGAGRAARLLAAVPNAIGVHWFQYTDEPPGGRADGEDYDFGLVDVDDRPYEGLVAALRDSNRMARQEAARTVARHCRARRTRYCRGPTSMPPARTSRLAEGRLAVADARRPVGGAVRRRAPGLGRARAVPGDDLDGLLRARVARPAAAIPASEAFRIALGLMPAAARERVESRVVPQEVRPDRAAGNQAEASATRICRWHAG